MGFEPHAMTLSNRFGCHDLPDFSSKRQTASLWLLLLLSFFLGVPPIATAAGEQAEPAAASLSAAGLWQAAEEAVEAGDREKAAALFGRLHRQDREAEQAAEALWQEARLRHELALGQEEPDWEQVRDLYRLYVTEYLEGEHFEEAYLGLGLAHFRMYFFREALIYLKFFLDRFPRSPLRVKASYWQGRTLVEIGRPGEAERIYRELAADDDRHFRVKAKESLADLYFSSSRFQDALASYEGLLREFAPHTGEHLEIIRKLGLTHGRLGHEVACRDHLYRYLNVVESSRHEAAVLFELGESSWRAAEMEAARVLYTRALAKARPEERAAVLSHFRLALVDSRQGQPSWQKPDDTADEAGDKYYQAVFDTYGREPIAQEARHALLLRLMARGESEQALLLAKAYLNGPGGDAVQRGEVQAILGGLLSVRVEKLLEAREYRLICDLYQEEHRSFSAYRKGRLLYLAGQAFEALGLYEQAAVIYYRALAGELTPEERRDLYERRARVYLAKGDLEAAERLLAYLRDLYAGQKEIGEVLHLSGRLLQAQGNVPAAASFYAEACGAAAGGQAGACLAEVHLLLQRDLVEEAAAALTRSHQQNRLAPEELQQGYGELGDGWRRQGQAQRALAAYAVAIGEGMPPETKEAQRVHLGLADLSLKLGRPGEGIAHYEKARSGPDPLLVRSAEEGLRQAAIERGVAELRSLDLVNGASP